MLDAAVPLAAIVMCALVLTSIVLTALHYPYDTDRDDGARGADSTERDYYEHAYAHARESKADGRFRVDDEYVRKARSHAQDAGVPQLVQSFVDTYDLGSRQALEIGAGSGLLQDAVDDYVGVDLSSAARRFFHKPFVAASVSHLPFRDDTFDAVWSIWVLEHIANPERALHEIRRVVRNGGYILLRPAWNVDPWAAEGYEARPYGDLGLMGKLIKATIPIRVSSWYSLFHSRQVRIVRTLATVFSRKPSRLHFVRLKPNYSKYWVTDSDAVVSLEFFEIYLWFTSRGDQCLNCPSRNALLFGLPGRRSEALVLRVNKG